MSDRFYTDKLGRPRNPSNKPWTVCFLFMTVPVALLVTAVTVLSLVVTFPIILYSALRGQQKKNPWKRSARNVAHIRHDSTE